MNRKIIKIFEKRNYGYSCIIEKIYQIAKVVQTGGIIVTILQCLLVTVKRFVVFSFCGFDNAQIHPSGRKLFTGR